MYDIRLLPTLNKQQVTQTLSC